MLKNSLIIISFLSLNNLPIENYNEAFIGIWAEFHSSETVQVFRVGNGDIYFERFLDNVLVASGKMDAGELEIQVERSDINSKYKLEYSFSPDQQVLSVMKPNSTEAWLLYKIR